MKLFATLRENREKIFELDVDTRFTTKDLIEGLEIPLQDVAIIMINGRSCDMDRQLHTDDVVALFPPVGGG